MAKSALATVPPEDNSRSKVELRAYEARRTPLFYRLLAVAVVLASLYILVPNHFALYEGHGLDPSWKLGLHLAFREGLIWGRDFVFTYGPLGVLSSRLEFADCKALYIASDLFVLGNLAWIFWAAFKRNSSPTSSLVLLAVVIGAGWNVLSIDLSITLLFINLFHLFSVQPRAYSSSRTTALNFTHLVIAGVAASLAFYIKVNTGIAGLLAWCGYVGLLWWRERSHLFCAGSLSALMVTNLILLSLLPVDLGPYVFNSLEVISGYNDGLFVTLEGRGYLRNIAVGLLVLCGLAFVGSLPLLRRSPFDLLRCTIIAATLFVLFKQGFVRADGHEQTFFNFAPVALGILYLTSSGWLRGRAGVLTVAALIVAVLSTTGAITATNFKEEALAVPQYFKAVWSPGLAEPPRLASPLPDSFVRRIGSSTVDIFPWDISYLYGSQLHYRPRPIMQSYSVYTPRLEELNYAHFLSPAAPEFVVLSIACVDGRYCFADEVMSTIALKQRYEVVESTPAFILLHRKEPVSQKTEVQVLTSNAELGSWVPVPKDFGTTLMLTAEPKYSIAGRLRAALYKPAELRLKLKIAGKGERDYRMVRQALLTGVPIGEHVESVDEVAKFLAADAVALSDVEAFMLYSSSSFGYAAEYPYTLANWNTE